MEPPWPECVAARSDLQIGNLSARPHPHLTAVLSCPVNYRASAELRFLCLAQDSIWVVQGAQPSTPPQHIVWDGKPAGVFRQASFDEELYISGTECVAAVCRLSSLLRRWICAACSVQDPSSCCRMWRSFLHGSDRNLTFARVIWSADRTVRKRFTATTDVLHAGWGSFADGGRTLCVLQAAELTTVSDSGQVNTLPLAAAYTRVWSLPAGILLTVGQTVSHGAQRNTSSFATYR